MVTVYTAPSCMQCYATTKHLNKDGVTYRTVDVSADEDARRWLADLGYSTAPVVTVETQEGVDHWSGYRPDSLDAIAYVQKGA